LNAIRHIAGPGASAALDSTPASGVAAAAGVTAAECATGLCGGEERVAGATPAAGAGTASGDGVAVAGEGASTDGVGTLAVWSGASLAGFATLSAGAGARADVDGAGAVLSVELTAPKAILVVCSPDLDTGGAVTATIAAGAVTAG